MSNKSIPAIKLTAETLAYLKRVAADYPGITVSEFVEKVQSGDLQIPEASH